MLPRVSGIHPMSSRYVVVVCWSRESNDANETRRSLLFRLLPFNVHCKPRPIWARARRCGQWTGGFAGFLCIGDTVERHAVRTGRHVEEDAERFAEAAG